MIYFHILLLVDKAFPYHYFLPFYKKNFDSSIIQFFNFIIVLPFFLTMCRPCRPEGCGTPDSDHSAAGPSSASTS